MMAVVDTKISDLAHPVADPRIQHLGPEQQVIRDIRASQSNALKAGNTGITRGKIAPSAVGRSSHEIDDVAGGTR